MKSEPHPSAPRNLCRPGASFRPHAVHLLRQPNLLPLCFHTLTNPFFPNSLVFTSIQNPRGCHPPNISVQDFATSASLCLCGKPFSFKCLRALDLSLRSFSRPFPLFSIACGLFLQNTRGGISRRELVRCTEAEKCISVSPLFATLTHSVSRKSFPCHSYANTRDGGVTSTAELWSVNS